MKKILSILLIVAVICTLSTASVTTMAAEKTDTKFFSAIGVFPEEVDENAALTRIDLAEIFYNIVFSYQSEAGKSWGEFNFTDVPEDKKHIASTAAGLGAMRGYSADVFAPDAPLTYDQAVKAIVSFLGYSLQADSMGGYPSGYLAQASRLQILPYGNIAGDYQATYGLVAAILKKAINKDIAVWNHTGTDGTAILDVLEGTDYLEYYMGISLTRGRITGNYLTNIKSGENTNYFGILINGMEMKVAKSAHGLQDMLGYDVYVYYTVENEVKTAIYYELGYNSVIDIDAGDITNVTKTGIKYYAEGSDNVVSADFASNAVLIYNGTSEPSFTPADVNPFAANRLDGGVKLIDADGDGIFEVIVVTAFKTIVVRGVIDNKIYSEYDNGDENYRVIDISNYKERNINIRNINGGAVDPKEITKGLVLNVCMDKNGAVKEIIGSKDSMVGVIEEISYRGGEIYSIKVSGAEFKTSAGLVLVDSANKFKSGATATIFFNSKADIALVDLEQNYTDGYNTGYLVDAAMDGLIEKSVICMIYDSIGEMKTFNLSDRVVMGNEVLSAENVLNAFGKVGKRVKRQLILYKTDLEGTKVTAIEIPQKIAKDEDAYNGIYEFPGTSHYYSGGHRTIDDKYLGNDTTICFAVPSEADRDKYQFYSMTTLPKGEGDQYQIGTKDKPLADMQIFGTKEEALVVSHAVLPSSLAGNSSDGLDKRPLFVVKKVSTAANEEGEILLKVTGFYIRATNLLEGSFYIDQTLLTTGHESGYPTNKVATGTRPFINQLETMMEPGDIFKTPHFENGDKIETMNCEQFYQIYDIGSDTFLESDGVGYSLDRSSGGTFHYFGYVVYNDGTAIKTVRGNEVAPEVPQYKAYELSSGYYKFIEITKRASDGEVTVKAATANAIRSEKTFPGNASRVLTLLRGAGIGCVILNFK